MSGCSLVAPGLVAQVSGQAPIFQYVRPHTSDYFGVQMTYLQSTTTCYGQNSIPKFTPIIQNTAASYTKTCQFLTTTSYTGIFCTGAPVSDLPDGELTVTFKGYTGNALTAPIPFTASFGPSPAAATATSTATVTATSTQTNTVGGGFASTSTVNGGYAATVTAPGGPSSTQTAFAPNTTVTTTNTVNGTTAVTSTKTNTVSSCSTLQSSSSISTTGPPSVTSSSTTAVSTFSPAVSSSTTPKPSSATPSTSSSSSSAVAPSSSSSSSSASAPSTSSSSSSAAAPSTSSSSSSAAAPSTSSSSSSAAAPSISSSSSTAAAPSTSSSTSSVASSSAVQPTADSSISSTAVAPSTSSSVSSVASSSAVQSTTDSSVQSSPSLTTQSVTSPSTVVSSSSPSSPTSTTAVASPTSSPYCNADNGTTFSTSAGDFIIECGIDRYDNDLGIVSGPQNFSDCIKACATTSQCVDVSWNGNCYLKNGIGAPNQNSNVWGARLLSAPTTSAAATTAPATTSAVATNSSSGAPQTVTVTTTISNTAYDCQCTQAPIPATGAKCPDNDNSLYISSCGAQYVIECSTDRYGSDLPNGYSSQSSLAACINDCDNTAGCVDVSWVISGACYKKGSIADVRKNDNIWGARQVSGCTSSANTVSSSSQLKLHRKRVVRSDPDVKHVAPVLKSHNLGKRVGGIAYGPDETYITTTNTAMRTATVTSRVTATTTVRPSGIATVTAAPSGTTTVTTAKSGVATTTSFTTATATVNSTSYTTSTATVTAAVTTCPAIF